MHNRNYNVIFTLLFRDMEGIYHKHQIIFRLKKDNANFLACYIESVQMQKKEEEERLLNSQY